MERKIFAVGLLLTGLGVILGGAGAHYLSPDLSLEMLGTFETAVRYQMYHGLGLLGLAWAIGRWTDNRFVLAATLLIVGTVLFSGSLYVLVMTGARWLGAVTPVGGGFLIAGWGLAAWAAFAPQE